MSVTGNATSLHCGPTASAKRGQASAPTIEVQWEKQYFTWSSPTGTRAATIVGWHRNSIYSGARCSVLAKACSYRAHDFVSHGCPADGTHHTDEVADPFKVFCLLEILFNAVDMATKNPVWQ
jgi:hypothetical protein